MYDHKQVEQEILSFWKKNKTYQKVKQNNKKEKGFYFADGPPYATGQMHPGTGWNKSLKDTVCRYWTGIGYNVRTQLGYDTHGLPIEVKVEKEMGIKNKNEIEKMGIEKFIKECKKFATKYIGIMNTQFSSLGVWMDYDDPYITYKDEYINSSWKTLKMAWDKKLMHEGKYVLPYCYRCETTIANYELEYADETDPSIYVKFRIKDKDEEYLIVWTTTPWTLVANMGVMVHPTFEYVKVKVDNETWYIAKEKMEEVLEKAGKSGTILGELSGKKLEGMEYEHPFQDKIKKESIRKVVLSDEYVNLEQGTGLVHTAPGTGPEDFIIGKRYGLDIFSPIDEQGCYTEKAGDFFGKNVKEANPEIIELLENRGVMIHTERIKHRYPHCWRCKTPLIFMTTNQWFISISKVKEKMFEEIEKIEWHPEFAKSRFKDFVTAAPDWCISRQRYWGIPLPIWKCEKCSELRVIGDRNELPKVKELHRPYVDKIELDCACKGKMKRVPDVMDVWFDSGNSVWATLKDGEEEIYGNQAEIIIEGQDQIRGWFYSLLGSGVVRYNKSPYKKLLMHGFFVNEKGEKMSKSLGNFVPLEEIIEKSGADSFRLWGLSNTIWDELKFNWDELKEAKGDLVVLYNLYTFLTRFCDKKPSKPKELTKEDEWMVSELNRLLKNFHEDFQGYEINKGVKEIRKFLVYDLSKWYMKFAKERISKNENKEATLWILYNSIFTVNRLLGIVCPFITEYIYQGYFRKFEKKGSLFLINIEKSDEKLINEGLKNNMERIKEIFTDASTVRQKAGIKKRWPIRVIYLETTSQEVRDAVEMFGGLLKSLLNIKNITVVDAKPDGKLVDGEFLLGKIYVDSELDEELYEEGMMNEVKRRVQNMRKEAGLVEKDKIEVDIDAKGEMKAIIEKHAEILKNGVNAKKINFTLVKKGKSYEIDGREIVIEVKKVGK